jgi:hypothetical protein
MELSLDPDNWTISSHAKSLHQVAHIVVRPTGDNYVLHRSDRALEIEQIVQ